MKFFSFSFCVLLFSLALHARVLSQTEIDKMLDRLAESQNPRIPEQDDVHWDVGGFPIVDYDYVCPKCHVCTKYTGDQLRIGHNLKEFRKHAIELKSLGLDVELDESALCRRCSDIPFSARIKRLPDSSKKNGRFPWEVGDEIEIHSLGNAVLKGAPAGRIGWVWSSYLNATGVVCVTHDESREVRAFVRAHPDLRSVVIESLDEGDRADVLPHRAEDPKGWSRIRLNHGCTANLHGYPRSMSFPIECFDLSDRRKGAGDCLCSGRILSLRWLINGRRICIGNFDYDVAILRAFLQRRKTFRSWEHGNVEPLKKYILRLRQLLQGLPVVEKCQFTYWQDARYGEEREKR